MKKTQKFWISSWVGSQGVVHTTLFSNDPTRPGMTVHGTMDVEYDIPDPDEITPLLVDALREKQTEIKALAMAECVEIDGQIQSLMAIGHEVTA